MLFRVHSGLERRMDSYAKESPRLCYKTKASVLRSDTDNAVRICGQMLNIGAARFFEQKVTRREPLKQIVRLR